MEVCKKIVSPSVADIFATMVCFIASAVDQKPNTKHEMLTNISLPFQFERKKAWHVLLKKSWDIWFLVFGLSHQFNEKNIH